MLYFESYVLPPQLNINRSKQDSMIQYQVDLREFESNNGEQLWKHLNALGEFGIEKE